MTFYDFFYDVAMFLGQCQNVCDLGGPDTDSAFAVQPLDFANEVAHESFLCNCCLPSPLCAGYLQLLHCFCSGASHIPASWRVGDIL